MNTVVFIATLFLSCCILFTVVCYQVWLSSIQTGYNDIEVLSFLLSNMHKRWHLNILTEKEYLYNNVYC